MLMRYFHCPKCKTVMTAPKIRNLKKEKYKGNKHRKTMWCPICKSEQRFILDESFKI